MTFEHSTLGAAYRELRKRRGLAIKQVRGDLDASAVSHFERDSADIRMTNLVALLAPTGMPVDEFTQLLPAATSSVAATMRQLSAAYDRGDATAIAAMLSNYADAQPATPPRYLIRLIVASCYAELAQQPTQLAAADAEFVSDYLMQDGRWFGLEYIAFGNLAYSLPPQTNTRLLAKMLREYRAFHLSSYTPLFTAAVYNLAVNQLEAGDYAETRRLLAAAEPDITDSSDLYRRIHFAFLRLLTPWLESRQAQDAAALNQFLTVTALIDPTLATKFRTWQTQLVARHNG
ncbi:helix-turn-helix domain-containing protein [Lacticaseibacillus parakribbianus]|uniref:helix-turn-helix domain-containing protein n=1 Tax=Lacticaseibacillus parakribbianus TaxID=2970927 RepID=UPI0021CB85B2|nr:Rgg/GadR/MutR family transcriptional regulator [Lacticaseibacillus parakribbianus]